jgi:putative heme-binding domain-containing protein
LEKMDAAQLVEQLRSPERWVRDQARRLLASKDAVPEDAWKPADVKPEFLYELLALYATRGDIPQPLLLKCLSHEDARLRAYSVRLWSMFTETPGQDQPDEEHYFIKRLVNAVNDTSPRVRLEAVIGASYFNAPEAVELALGVIDHPRDRFIDYALANTIRATKPVWQPALEAGHMTFEGNVAHLAFLLQTDGQADTAGALAAMLAARRLSPEKAESLRILLIGSGSAEQLAVGIRVGDMTLDVADALIKAARLRGVKPAGDWTEAFAEWWESSGPGMPGLQTLTLARLAAAWGMEEEAAVIPRLISSPNPNIAAPAVRALAEWKGRDAVGELEALTKDENSDVIEVALEEWLKLDPAKAAPAVAAVIAKPGILEVSQLLLAALQIEGTPELLAESLTKTPPPAATALRMLKTLATAGRNEPALAAVLRKAAGLPENASVVPDYSAEFVAKLIADAKASGDAARGREVFTAAQSACLGCHKVGDEGGVTGPNLTAIGRGMTPELVTESLLWPRRQIKEGFFLSTVTTHDGKVVSGYKVSEDAKTLTLRPPGVEVVESVAKDKIKDRSDTGTLMPDGLTSWMTEQQRLDLLRYLFELGK